MTTYVYFIQQGRGSVKIGVSDDPEKRLRTMQTGNQKPLRLLGSVPFQSRSDAFEVEKYLHEKYSHYRSKGEWFRRAVLKEIKIKGKRLIGGSGNRPGGGLIGGDPTRIEYYPGEFDRDQRVDYMPQGI